MPEDVALPKISLDTLQTALEAIDYMRVRFNEDVPAQKLLNAKAEFAAYGNAAYPVEEKPKPNRAARRAPAAKKVAPRARKTRRR